MSDGLLVVMAVRVVGCTGVVRAGDTRLSACLSSTACLSLVRASLM